MNVNASYTYLLVTFIILGILPAHRMCCWNVKLENTKVNSRLKMRFILFPSLQLIRIIKTFCRTGFWHPLVNILMKAESQEPQTCYLDSRACV